MFFPGVKRYSHSWLSSVLQGRDGGCNQSSHGPFVQKLIRAFLQNESLWNNFVNLRSFQVTLETLFYSYLNLCPLLIVDNQVTNAFRQSQKCLMWSLSNFFHSFVIIITWMFEDILGIYDLSSQQAQSWDLHKCKMKKDSKTKSHTSSLSIIKGLIFRGRLTDQSPLHQWGNWK